MKTTLTIFFIIISLGAFSQTEAPVFIPDTIIHIEYYKSNQVKIYDARIEGVPSNQYSLKRWYTRSGKTIYTILLMRQKILFTLRSSEKMEHQYLNCVKQKQIIPLLIEIEIVRSPTFIPGY